MRALDQVVTEQVRRGETARQRLVERGQVINALAVITALVRQVLIHVGNGAGIGVYAARVGEQARKITGRGARQARADARLQDSVAAHDQRLAEVDFGCGLVD